MRRARTSKARGPSKKAYVLAQTERSAEPSLLQTVYLRNDLEVQKLIDRPDGWLKQVSKSKVKDADELIRQAYLRVLARAGVIDVRLRDAALAERLELRRGGAAPPVAFVERKGATGDDDLAVDAD